MTIANRERNIDSAPSSAGPEQDFFVTEPSTETAAEGRDPHEPANPRLVNISEGRNQFYGLRAAIFDRPLDWQLFAEAELRALDAHLRAVPQDSVARDNLDRLRQYLAGEDAPGVAERLRRKAEGYERSLTSPQEWLRTWPDRVTHHPLRSQHPELAEAQAEGFGLAALAENDFAVALPALKYGRVLERDGVQRALLDKIESLSRGGPSGPPEAERQEALRRLQSAVERAYPSAKLSRDEYRLAENIPDNDTDAAARRAPQVEAEIETLAAERIPDAPEPHHLGEAVIDNGLNELSELNREIQAARGAADDVVTKQLTAESYFQVARSNIDLFHDGKIGEAQVRQTIDYVRRQLERLREQLHSS